MTQTTRRIFLRGLGGALVAAPFLSSVFERSAKAQQAAPRRTIVMFTHYGCVTNKWFPSKLDGELTANDLLPTTLAPLAPFASKLLMPRGIRAMNEWTANNKGAGMGRGQGVDSHIQVSGSAFTLQPVSPNINDPFGFQTFTRFVPKPVGPSLDYVMAQQLSPGGAPLFMNTTGQVSESAQSAISYSAADTLGRGSNANQAFTSLTNLFQPNQPPSADSWAIKKGKTIADIVRGDLSRLMSRDMSRADKDKLAAWVELANDVGKVVAAAPHGCGQDTADFLGASSKLGTGADGDVLTRKVSDTMDNADLYSALAALAAACNSNPVIFLKYPPAFVFTGLGLTGNSHNLSHRLDSAIMAGTCVPNAIADLLKIDSYYAQKFANLVKMLDSISEGDGTLLDNTIAVWMMEDSDGSAHNLNNLPIIQAGSGGGYFKTGKVINLDSGSGATPEQMLGRSLAHCTADTDTMITGIDQATGTPPEFGNAPINKYFCNIMNAMGMRAGADGFPAVDGPSSEVTHFGYSDKTEDFCGGVGAVEGAGIHDPGGFSELKART
ncbi:MAG TPA: DUF1552 domain-containing protein [Polyangiaceae bacterium]|nr:DUF1552 domain-containing protein [Polyangiaceae bacterium]